MSRKTQRTRFEDKILRKLANEDKPQVVTACVRLTPGTVNEGKKNRQDTEAQKLQYYKYASLCKKIV